jgi:hypothetical protein|eukprot:COSAG01_NODE_1440_length_10297_cov_8.117572_8_plen_66_part_00
MTMSGGTAGVDIGGYQALRTDNRTQDELMVRWMQFGTFTEPHATGMVTLTLALTETENSPHGVWC